MKYRKIMRTATDSALASDLMTFGFLLELRATTSPTSPEGIPRSLKAVLPLTTEA